jgi:hypothetical protein
MRSLKILRAILMMGAMVMAMPLAATAQQVLTESEVVDKIVAQEQVEVQLLRQYSPLVETYIQNLRVDKQHGAAPNGDKYFLGRALLANGVELESLDHNTGMKHKLAVSWSGIFSEEYVPRGFLQMIYLDMNGFDRGHYNFKYARREFLGEVRCLVFDVDPLPKSGKGRFVGRIWVEDQNYHIVRFNGAYGGSSAMSSYFDFDSWRTNAGKNLWLPAFIYSEAGNDRDTKSGSRGFKAFRAQTRLWGYNLGNAREEQELNKVLVEAAIPVNDRTESANDYTPFQAEQTWSRQAEDNVTERLERQGLLAPYGEVDKALETVVNNLEVTNNLDIQPEVRCRVMMTSTLESFTIGHTIVLSRGLIDVVPDEATLAAMVAEGIADAMVPKSYQDQYGFSDVLRLSSREILKRLSFLNEKKDTEENSVKAMELLNKSPYAAGLGNAGLFLAQLHSQAKELKQLISPRLGNQVFLASQLLQSAPALQRDNKEQIAALPLGARVKMDPYSDRVTLMKTKASAPNSAREKMPFEVTPLVPYLTRYAESAEAAVDSNAAVALNQQN